MRPRIRLLVLFGLAMLLRGTALAQRPASQALDEQTVRSLQDAVVLLEIEGIDVRNKPVRWGGTGFFVDRTGWVITNKHVVPGSDGRRAGRVTVIMHPGSPGEQRVPATFAYEHTTRDVALLRCLEPSSACLLLAGGDVTVRQTDQVWVAGFPYGALIADDRGQLPSLSISSGTVTALRHAPGRPLSWLDADTAAAPGNSGSPLIDRDGHVLGVLAQKYDAFARIVPASAIHQLLGEALFRVTLDPPIAPRHGGTVRVQVGAREPGWFLDSGDLRIEKYAETPVDMVRDGDALAATVKLPALPDESPREVPLTLCIKSGGSSIRWAVRLPLHEEPTTELVIAMRSIWIAPKKADGSAWDVVTGPDPFLEARVNGIVCRTSTPVYDVFRLALAVTGREPDVPGLLRCRSGDRVELTVWDADRTGNDMVGRISFIARPGEVVRSGTDQIERCEIDVRAAPIEDN